MCDSKKTPRVSILINCYNGEKYLREAIDSVINQTFRDWEIIFWDNQSTDASAEIFKSYKDDRLRYFYAPNHTLLYEARNNAFSVANGEYISFLDVDDWWKKNKLELQIAQFVNKEVGLVCSNYYIYNQERRRLSIASRKKLAEGAVLDSLLEQYYVGLLTLMVSRNAIVESGALFNPRYHIIGDFDIVIRLASSWRMRVIQSPLAYNRIHRSSESFKHRSLTLQELKHWYEEHIDDLIIGKSKKLKFVRYSILYREAVMYLLSGHKIKALENALEIPWGLSKLRLAIGLLIPSIFTKYIRK